MNDPEPAPVNAERYRDKLTKTLNLLSTIKKGLRVKSCFSWSVVKELVSLYKSGSYIYKSGFPGYSWLQVAESFLVYTW